MNNITAIPPVKTVEDYQTCLGRIDHLTAVQTKAAEAEIAELERAMTDFERRILAQGRGSVV